MKGVNAWPQHQTGLSNAPDEAEVAFKAAVERTLQVMTPVAPASWIDNKQVTRIFNQSEYEAIRNLLIAYLQIVK